LIGYISYDGSIVVEIIIKIKNMSKTTRGKHIQKLSYMAGFFDGEGSIYITKTLNKRSGNYVYILGIGCSNSEREPIDILHNMFSPYRKTHTHTYGRKSTYKDCYIWVATSNVALNFLKIIEPYLLVKKKQAMLGIKFQEWRNELPRASRKRTPDIIKESEKYRYEMKKLNGTLNWNVSSRND